MCKALAFLLSLLGANEGELSDFSSGIVVKVRDGSIISAYPLRDACFPSLAEAPQTSTVASLPFELEAKVVSIRSLCKGSVSPRCKRDDVTASPSALLVENIKIKGNSWGE